MVGVPINLENNKNLNRGKIKEGEPKLKDLRLLLLGGALLKK